MAYRCDTFWGNTCCDNPETCEGQIYLSDGEYCKCPNIDDPWYFIEMEEAWKEELGDEEYFQHLKYQVEDGHLREKDRKEIIKYFKSKE